MERWKLEGGEAKNQGQIFLLFLFLALILCPVTHLLGGGVLEPKSDTSSKAW